MPWDAWGYLTWIYGQVLPGIYVFIQDAGIY